MRPRDGEPQRLVEHFSQWLWQWRVPLALAYLVGSCVAALVLAILQTLGD